MTRILADLSDDDIRWLDACAVQSGRSRAAILRDAVTAFRAQMIGAGIERHFGMWKDRRDIGDAVAWQRRERAAATRPWDPDFDAVRAEFPDLFTEADAIERERYRP